MAPPSNLPRLNQITSKQAADEAVDLLWHHIERLNFQLSPGNPAPPRPELGASDLGVTVAFLAEYAITGVDPENNDLVHDRLGDVLGAMYTCAARPNKIEARDLLDELDSGEPTTALEVVLLAAWARQRLSEGEALGKRELGCLGSLSLRVVQQLAKSGELVTNPEGRVLADDARRWLAGRGVKGF